MVQSLWALVNSPVGVALILAAVAWAIKRSVMAKSLAEKYSGTVIQWIKAAEKSIPDDTANAGLRRFDWALRQILTFIEQAEGRVLTRAEVTEVQQAVSVEHANLEADGNLGTPISGSAVTQRERATQESGGPGERRKRKYSAGRGAVGRGWKDCAQGGGHEL